MTDRRDGARRRGARDSKMFVRATLLGALAIASLVAAAATDTAVIVNSGSTNMSGYKITIASDGNGSMTPQNRGGTPTGQPKTFTIPAASASRFFGDLAAARAAKLATEPCMKSASFGSTTHVTWQGWTSPDLDCPPQGPASSALVKDVDEIRKASGAAALPLKSVPLQQ